MSNRKDLMVGESDLTVDQAEPSGLVGRLQALRLALGHRSWDHFAVAAGVSTAAIEKWRRGEAAPFRSTLAKIAERTGARLEWLETGEGEMLLPVAMPVTAADVAALIEAGRTDHPFFRTPPGQLALATAARAAQPPAAEPVSLQRLVSLEDLVAAYQHARRVFAGRGVATPDDRKLLALTLSLYDAAMETLAEPDAAARPAQNPPAEQT